MAACRKHVYNFAKFSILSQKWTSLRANHVIRRWQTTNTVVRREEEPSEFSETPEYPPCHDTSLLGRERRCRQRWYDEVLNAPTVEEKYLLVVPKLLARKVAFILRGENVFSHYNTMPLIKFATRTHFVEGLPQFYQKQIDTAMVDAIVERLIPPVLIAIRTIFMNCEFHRRRESKYREDLGEIEKRRGQLLIDVIHRAISALLCQEFDHLKLCQVDYKPRCDSFWYAGGFPVLPQIKRYRKRKGLVVDPDAPMDQIMQYIGCPYIQIRNEDPLPAFADLNEDLCLADDQNHSYESNPNSAGFFYNWRFASNVPGFWPGEPCGFGTMSYHTRERATWTAKLFGEDSVQKTLHSYGILASFGWLNGLAFNKGFTSYQDLTYPITTQTVVTNGRLWSFYVYQLNTVSFLNDFIHGKSRNVCWGTDELKLFETVSDGEVHGFNSEVLKSLVRFYLNSPKSRVGVDLTPYLRDVKHSDVEWEDYRRNYKHRNANRPFTPGILEKTWFSKIYKEWFNTRIDKLR